MSEKDTVSSFTNASRWSLTFKIGGIFLCSFVIFIAVILPLSVYIVDSTAHTAVNNTVAKKLQSSLDMGAEYLHSLYGKLKAVHQISGNVESVKQQALSQAASVTETAATVEEIIRSIKQLNSGIETQAASVAESSSAIEQMVANIASITQTLNKTQVNDMSCRLMDAMSEQEKGSKEVLVAIKDINAVTAEVQAGSEEMLKGGEGVAQEMQKLDTLTRVITSSMNEMASGAIQINNAVQDVNEITQKINRILMILRPQ